MYRERKLKVRFCEIFELFLKLAVLFPLPLSHHMLPHLLSCSASWFSIFTEVAQKWFFPLLEFCIWRLSEITIPWGIEGRERERRLQQLLDVQLALLSCETSVSHCSWVLLLYCFDLKSSFWFHYYVKWTYSYIL